MEHNNLIKKGVVVAVILLFISVSVVPATGNKVFNDDTTPPVTTISFDPPTPDGDNGWFVSDVTTILNATDDMSGVNATYYRLNEGEWETYTEPFVIQSDGHCLIEYYSVDNAGNEEDVKSFVIKIDQTSPDIELYYEAYKKRCKWYVTFTAICSDATSGINRVELYINDGLVSTDDKEPYEWTFEWSDIFEYVLIKAVAFDNAGNSDFDDNPEPIPYWTVIGLILNPEISENNITFFAVIVRWSYNDGWGMPDEGGTHMFKRLSFPNNYGGYMGKFFIFATFYKY